MEGVSMLESSMYFEDPASPLFETWLAESQEAYPDGGILVLLAEKNAQAVSALQAMLAEYQYPLLGGIFPGLVKDAGFVATGMVVTRFKHMPRWFLLPQDSDDPAENAAKIFQSIDPELSGDHRKKLFMVFDGMLPKIASTLEQLYLELSDQVTYLGVNAGSETFQPMPCLFDGESLVGQSVLCLLLEDEEAVYLEHGYTPPEQQKVATGSSGNQIVSIDWKPAFEVYAQMLKEHYQVELTRENFYQHAVHFPFGIQKLDGSILVRIPVHVDDDGSIFCVGEIPENSVLTLLKASGVGDMQTVKALQDKSSGKLRLLFYCAGRRMHLGEDADQELDYLKKQNGNELLGALSLGEIGNTSGKLYPYFHNAALVYWTCDIV